jgi:hypothetical protein
MGKHLPEKQGNKSLWKRLEVIFGIAGFFHVSSMVLISIGINDKDKIFQIIGLFFLGLSVIIIYYFVFKDFIEFHGITEKIVQINKACDYCTSHTETFKNALVKFYAGNLLSFHAASELENDTNEGDNVYLLMADLRMEQFSNYNKHSFHQIIAQNLVDRVNYWYFLLEVSDKDRTDMIKDLFFSYLYLKKVTINCSEAEKEKNRKEFAKHLIVKKIKKFPVKINCVIIYPKDQTDIIGWIIPKIEKPDFIVNIKNQENVEEQQSSKLYKSLYDQINIWKANDKLITENVDHLFGKLEIIDNKDVLYYEDIKNVWINDIGINRRKLLFN